MNEAGGQARRGPRIASWSERCIAILAACSGLLLGASCSEPLYETEPEPQSDGGSDGEGAMPEAPLGAPARGDGGEVDSDAQASRPRDDAAMKPVLPDGGKPSDRPVNVPPTTGQPPDSVDPGSVNMQPEGGFQPGYYGIRARFYAIDTGGVSGLAQEIVMLGRVVRDAQSGALTLNVQSCDDHATSGSGALSINARLAAPERYPTRSYRLLVSGDTFESETNPTLVGYTAETPMTCPAGSRVPAPEGQEGWRNSTTCTCARNDRPPTSPDDCRVIDSDGDDKPGFTVRWTGFVDGVVYAARRDLSKFADGKISPNGSHRAHYLWNHDHHALSCAAGACSTESPQYQPCGAGVRNPVIFAPLGEGSEGAEFTCADVMERQKSGALFPDEPLGIPNDC